MLDKAVDVSIVKLTNYKAVWGYIHSNRQATIPQISKAIGLSLPTVTRAVDYGVSEGILRAAGVMGSERGRKAEVYTLYSDFMHFLLILVDTKNVYYKVHNFLSITIKSGEVPVNNDNVFDTIDKITRQCVEEDSKISMIALAITGIVHENAVVESWAYPSLDGVAIRDHIEKSTGKIVLLDNDVHIAALAAESYDGHSDDKSVAVFSFGSSGYGVGIMINGAVVHGARGAAGELGDIPVRSTQEDGAEFYAEKLQSVLALLNPHRLIIHFSDENLSCASVIKIVGTKLKDYALPEIIYSRGFIADCFIGLSKFCERDLKAGLRSGRFLSESKSQAT